ncbi:MAG: two-component regulator propeller domain-containing protein [Niabella sp.]
MAILQDKKGYLWFGTRDGLNKFDGSRFIVYRHYSSDTNSLSNNTIHAIYEDNAGNLWIGTQQGLNKYNPYSDNFIRMQLPGKSAGNALSGEIIRNILQVNDRFLWVATDNGILEVNIKNNKVEKIKKQENNPNSLSDNNTRFLLKAKDGTIWICNTKYVDIYNPKTKIFKHIEYPQKNKTGIHLNDLPTLFTDRKNTLWLGYEQGLATYNPGTQHFDDFQFNNTTPVNSGVRTICEDLSGNLWIGSYSGLYILNSERTKLQHIVHDDNISTSLSQNSIYKIIRDARGDMWVGTWADGLNYYNKDIEGFRNIAFGNTINKLNYKVVSGMVEDREGNLWIGTEGGGLNFYNRQTGKFTYYKNTPGNQNTLSANNVKAVLIDRNNNLWVGIHDGGVNVLNVSHRPFLFRNIDFAPGTSPVSLKAYKVLTLFEDKTGNIWIGTLTGGLILYDIQKKLLTKIDNDIKTIMDIAQTADPDVLIVGGDNGLETINIKTRQRSGVPFDNNFKKENSTYINCLFVDAYNHYWIGTEGNGAYMYDPENNKTIAYSTKQGLPNDIVYGMLADDHNNIWISTNNGLSRLEPATGKIKNYNQEDGLQGNEFNYGSYFKTKNGELFFGGTNGLTYFNPSDIQKNNFVPNIDITDIEVNNTPYLRVNDVISQITLKYNENNFSIDFTALNYMYPEKNEFAYKLEGIDKDWNYVGNQRKAVYTNIPKGNYIFKVKGSNGDGIWNEQGDSLKIKILPAPWKTWWAYLFYAAVCTGILLYIRKLIALRIKEKREKERIEQQDQMKLSLFTDASHEFRTPLTLILGPLKDMMDKKEGNSYIRQQHTIMYRNAGMLLQLINEILDFTKIDAGALSLQASENNIVSCIEEVKESFDLLANAFKFTEDNKTIILKIAAANNDDPNQYPYVEISIINFGDTLSAAQISRIFDPFYQLDHKNKNLGSGIGLSLVKKLVELHKGKITVKSTETGGTCFSVFLKSGNGHLSASEYVQETETQQEDPFFIDTVLDGNQQIEALDTMTNINAEETGAPCLLIVEDNADVQDFIQQIFAGQYTVLKAANGQEAILIAQQNPVDLIISDVQMPVMDGFDLCRHIKTDLVTSHIFVILLTAKTSTAHQEKGFHIGADAYITKPFNPAILKAGVDNLLKTRANLILRFKKDVLVKPRELAFTSPDEIFLGKAIALIEENLDNPEFNANHFVAKMYMSRTVLYTKLKALTGQNISTFIRTVRLKKAGIFLIQSDKTISQVAYEVGFNDLKYFRECFKEFYKVTPSDYKRMNSKY